MDDVICRIVRGELAAEVVARTTDPWTLAEAVVGTL